MNEYRVIIADPTEKEFPVMNGVIREFYDSTKAQRPLKIETTGDALEVRKLMMPGFDFAIVHNGLTRGKGIEVLEDLAAREEKSLVIITTASEDSNFTRRLDALQGKLNYAHLEKPFQLTMIIALAIGAGFPVDEAKLRAYAKNSIIRPQ